MSIPNTTERTVRPTHPGEPRRQACWSPSTA